MKDKLTELKEHIQTVILDYTELTNCIYDTRTNVSREQLEHFIETIEGLFDIESLKILKNSPKDYKYFAAVVKYFPELEFFNVFGVDYVYALYTQMEKSLKKEELFNYKSREEITKDPEVLDELEEIQKIKEKEELRQSYFSLNQRKYVKILNNYQKFVQDLGYAHPYDAYLDVYQIDGEELERQVDEFLENTKEEYSQLFEYFTSKYLPEEIPRREIYKQEELRYLYSCQKIEAN